MTERYLCKGRVEQKRVSVDFRWGQKLKVIRNIPARVCQLCQQCGEQYFQSGAYKAMEKLAAFRARPATQLTADVVQFK